MIPTPRSTLLHPAARVLAAACAATALCASAPALAHDDCASGISRSPMCIDGFAMPRTEHRSAPVMVAAVHADGGAKVMAIRAQSMPAPFMLETTPASTTAADDFETPAPLPAHGDPSVLGMLLAALGVLGFVAHRRSGR